jgi:lipopolysaccharide/colanic/teichoic acid biosynthesis glycosyltransferase
MTALSKKRFVFILFDILIVTLTFLFFIWIKPASLRIYLPNYLHPFLIFLGIWVVVSALLEKFKIKLIKKERDVFAPVLIANITIVIISYLLMYYYHLFNYSRMIVYGTILVSTILELILGVTHFYYKKPTDIEEFEDDDRKKLQVVPDYSQELVGSEDFDERRKTIRDSVRKEIGVEASAYLEKYMDIGNPKVLILSTTTLSNIERIEAGKRIALINLRRINDIKRINKFFIEINNKLPDGGLFVGNVETYVARYHRIMKKFPKGLNKFYYYFIDFPLRRVAPKIPLVKSVYFFLTQGRDRVLSKAETLGRLYSCGFEVEDEQLIGDRLFFVVKKIREPFDDKNPTYGPFIRLKRYGKGGKMIGVYKFRTMHPYSEYLQAYVHKMNSLQEGGKFKNDFRVHTVGKYMRKLWIDELPMFINVFKGEMKIVGIRPLSKHYFSLYTKEMQERRLKYKPGLVPPFYVDMPKTLDEIMASEKKYFDAYDKHPFLTDIKYFYKAFYNIIIKKARSN